MSASLNRRQFLIASGVAAAAGTITLARAAGPTRRPTLRIAHMTDIHVKPESGSPDGMRAALRKMHAIEPKIDLVLQGGDLLMDVFETPEARAEVQFDLAKQILSEECKAPIEHCLGNHDIWGWSQKKSGTTGTEARWGKMWWLEWTGYGKTYRSFDRGGWHFIVLDSVQPGDTGGYKPILDNEQFAWLEADLAACDPKTPVLVLSHIPIFSVGAMLWGGKEEKDGQWKIIRALMHLDARKIKDLFAKNPNVKLCLSGHIHLLDRIVYNNVTYICTGAVSGNWWKGKFQETAEGFGELALYEDGAFDYDYRNYGWEVPK